MQFDSMLNYVRMAMAFVVLATLGTAARAQDLPSFMAPIAGRTDTTPAQTAISARGHTSSIETRRICRARAAGTMTWSMSGMWTR